MPRAGWVLAVALGALVACGGPEAATAAAPPAAAGQAPSARHGGVVAMAGALHVEAVVFPDGRIRIYPTDLRRRALAAAELTGSVTVQAQDGVRTLPLSAAGDWLEA